MAKFSGTALYVAWIHSGGTANLTGNFTTVEFNQTADTIDTTSGNATAKEYLPGLFDVTYTVNGLYGGTAVAAAFGTAQLATLVPRSEGTIVIGPFGTVAGQPKYGGPAIVTGNPNTMPYGASGAYESNLEFQGNNGMYWNHGSAF
jgi:hypothetical protein